MDSSLLFPLRTETFWYCVSNTVSFLSVPIMLMWLLFVIFVQRSKAYSFAWLIRKWKGKVTLKYIYLFGRTGLSWDAQDLRSSLQRAGFFSCGLWDLDPWTEIEPRSLALRAWSFSHWTTVEVPKRTTVNTWVGHTPAIRSVFHCEPWGWRWRLLLEGV